MMHHTNNLTTRRGSVLILVVALLVLLALAGTAYLATVRIDRTSTGINTAITQTDLLMDSAKRLVEQKLIDDLPVVQRAKGVSAGSIRNWDHPEDDKWLADRVPTFFSPSSGAGFPVWRFVSAMNQTGDAYQFDSPWGAVGSGSAPGNKSLYVLEPTSDDVNPAFRIRLAADGAEYSPDLVAAADADGDGIADSPYYRLPGGRVGDLTYYIGVRIIDNTAAINVNTAWDRDADYTVAPTPVSQRHYGMFPSNVGLSQLLVDYNPANGLSGEMDNVNRYRVGSPTGGSPWLTTPADATPRVDFNLIAAPPTGPDLRDDLFFQTHGEALWTQLARRVDNPGFRHFQALDQPSFRYRSYSITDMMALAYRFCLGHTSLPPSLLERGIAPIWGLPSSLYTHPDLKDIPYAPGDALAWFRDNFDYDNALAITPTPPRRPVRSLLVTHNPVSNLAPVHVDSTTNNVPAAMLALDPTLALPTIPGTSQVLPIARTSINTGTFGELWRAFWAVMHDPTTATQVPTNTETRMFRAEHTGLSTPHDQLLLRAAIAAINAIDLRDFDDNISEQTITLSTGQTITVFGTEKQPFITEVLVHLGGAATDADDWMAIELYSPYNDLPNPISLTNWQLVAYDRATGTFTKIHSFGAGDVIPNRGFITLEANAAMRPADVEAPVSPTPVDDLRLAIGKELLLLRPRLASGALSGPEGTDANPNFHAMVPVDQVDLTGMSVEPTDPLGDEPVRWWYARIAPEGVGLSPDAWKCVYPGPHTAGGTPSDHGFVSRLAERGTLGTANDAASFTPEDFIIPLNDYQWPGPRYSDGMPQPPPTGKIQFPYGGFARNGDILMVPFIGGYVIADETRVLAMNSVTYDAAYAEEVAPNNGGQFVGRFAPITRTGTDAQGYEWADDLFDHLTAHQNPDSDYLPNLNPATYQAIPGRTGAAYAPQPVPNGPVSVVASANQGNEKTVGTHGLININTAPPQVLNMLLLKESLADPASATSAERLAHDLANRQIAQVIWMQQMSDRFRTPFDLLRLAPVRAMGDPALDLTAADLTEIHGDVTPFTPSAPAGDGVVDDFEQHYMALTRLSNLITTRSDSFTVYIVLEGWRDAGTAGATRITQQRAAFIVDRSGYIPANPRLKITNVPVE